MAEPCDRLAVLSSSVQASASGVTVVEVVSDLVRAIPFEALVRLSILLLRPPLLNRFSCFQLLGALCLYPRSRL